MEGLVEGVEACIERADRALQIVAISIGECVVGGGLAGIAYAEEVEREFCAEVGRELVDQRRPQADNQVGGAYTVVDGIALLILIVVDPRLVEALYGLGVAHLAIGALQLQVEVHVTIATNLILDRRRHTPTHLCGVEAIVLHRGVGSHTLVGDYIALQHLVVGEAIELTHHADVELLRNHIAHLRTSKPVAIVLIVAHVVIVGLILVVSALQTDHYLCLRCCHNCHSSNKKCYFLHAY